VWGRTAVFYYLTYEGACDIEAIEDPLIRKALIDQVANFGQTPKQLFKHPHPRRHPAPSAGPSAVLTPSPSTAPLGASAAGGSAAAAPTGAGVGVPATVVGGAAAFAAVDRYTSLAHAGTADRAAGLPVRGRSSFATPRPDACHRRNLTCFEAGQCGYIVSV